MEKYYISKIKSGFELGGWQERQVGAFKGPLNKLTFSTDMTPGRVTSPQGIGHWSKDCIQHRYERIQTLYWPGLWLLENNFKQPASERLSWLHDLWLVSDLESVEMTVRLNSIEMGVRKGTQLVLNENWKGIPTFKKTPWKDLLFSKFYRYPIWTWLIVNLLM